MTKHAAPTTRYQEDVLLRGGAGFTLSRNVAIASRLWYLVLQSTLNVRRRPMPRAFWKGVISFGLVAIPVKMYLGTESKTLSFHLLHKKCLTRPKQVLHCEIDNEYFGTKETVRGYEIAKEQYVVLDDSDFERVPIKTSHAIDILGFVEA